MAERPDDADRAGGLIRVVVVTPESTTLDTRARGVTLPLFDGRRGVARGHAPFIGRLGSGAVQVAGEREAAGTQPRRLFVDGGFVEVAHDTVTIITQRAIPAERIDPAAARAELDRLRTTRTTGDDAIRSRLSAEHSARALLRTAAGRG